MACLHLMCMKVAVYSVESSPYSLFPIPHFPGQLSAYNANGKRGFCRGTIITEPACPSLSSGFRTDGSALHLHAERGKKPAGHRHHSGCRVRHGRPRIPPGNMCSDVECGRDRTFYRLASSCLAGHRDVQTGQGQVFQLRKIVASLSSNPGNTHPPVSVSLLDNRYTSRNGIIPQVSPHHT